MAPVVTPDMRGQEPLHPDPEIAIAAWPQYEMKMVGHETPARHAHRYPRGRLPDHPREGSEVVGITEYRRAAVSPVDRVVAEIGGRGARGARRKRFLPS